MFIIIITFEFLLYEKLMMMISGQLQAYVTRVFTNQTFYYSNIDIKTWPLVFRILRFTSDNLELVLVFVRFCYVIIHLKTWHDMLRIVCHSLYCEFCLDIIFFFYVTCRNKVTKSNTVS